MAAFKRIMLSFGAFALIVLLGIFFTNYYSFIFSRKVKGVIVKVERVEINVALMQTTGTDTVNPKLYSFAVAIKEDSGEIVTASAEDRQWAVAQEGQCAEAVYYPYPPWKLDKANTYYGARLDKLMDCK
jgi:hypothetical protein